MRRASSDKSNPCFLTAKQMIIKAIHLNPSSIQPIFPTDADARISIFIPRWQAGLCIDHSAVVTEGKAKCMQSKQQRTTLPLVFSKVPFYTTTNLLTCKSTHKILIGSIFQLVFFGF